MCDSTQFFSFLTGLNFKDNEYQKLIVPVTLGFFFPKDQHILKQLRITLKLQYSSQKLLPDKTQPHKDYFRRL